MVHQLQFESLPLVEVNATILLSAVFEIKEQQTPDDREIKDDLEVVC